jgi:hypothetical protein
MLTYNELKEKCNCWKGYKRVPGTKPCAEDSCMKEELEKHHVLAFGRMNPITSGHEAVVNKLHSVAKEHGASHSLVVSHSQDAKKNPLTGEQKVAHAKNAFPGTNVSSASKDKPTILHHAAAAHAAGATHLHVVAGSDRHEEMHNLLHKYNGKDSGHGHYNFKKITVHSSGERDPDAEGTTGISASKMREHAASGNKAEFHKGAPSNMKPEHKDAMYNDVRKGMNIKEELRSDMGAAAYINDFIKSTNPRFNNKSKEERRKMAIGAFMAAKSKLKEGTLQGNIGGGDAMNTTTSAPSASTAKDTTMGKKIKGFKFFNGENDKQMNMNQPVKEEIQEGERGLWDNIHAKRKRIENGSGERMRKPGSKGAPTADAIKASQTNEEKKDDVPFDGPYKSTFKKPNNPSRTGMDAARSLAQRAMDQVSKKKPVKEAKDEQEYGYEGDMALNQLATLTRCAEMIKDCLKPETDLPEWVQSKITLATDYIQTAADYLYSESEVNEQQAPVAPVPDKKYIKGTPEHKAYKATKKPINGMPTNVKEENLDEKSDQAKQNKTMKNMMDASRGAKFKLNNPVPDTDHKTAREKNVAIGRALRSEAIAQKGVNVDKVNHAGDTPHEEKWEPAPKTVSKIKKVKEENMKSYKEFLQGLDEKLIGKQHKIDKNKNGKVDAHDFELLRKEEADHLLEYTPGPDGKTIIKGRSYGADYVDPEGADETAADMKKKEKKPAGRKTGQSTGSYKPRATMSKLKSAGSTYK